MDSDTATKLKAARERIGIPPVLYGTAWKAERTSNLVALALRTGFRGVDTACQPKHYREDLVGAALRDNGHADVWVQTKYTSPDGHGKRGTDKQAPYDVTLPVREQVHASLAITKKNLGLGRPVDCVLLHSPLRTVGETLKAWEVLKEAKASGAVRHIGASNVRDPRLLVELIDAGICPEVLQNPFCADTDFDADVRRICARNGIVYQSFWTITANSEFVRSREVGVAAKHLAEQLGLESVTHEQAWLRFVSDLGIVPLVGACDPRHMAEDLAVLTTDKASLSASDIAAISALIA